MYICKFSLTSFPIPFPVIHFSAATLTVDAARLAGFLSSLGSQFRCHFLKEAFSHHSFRRPQESL